MSALSVLFFGLSEKKQSLTFANFERFIVRFQFRSLVTQSWWFFLISCHSVVCPTFSHGRIIFRVNFSEFLHACN